MANVRRSASAVSVGCDDLPDDADKLAIHVGTGFRFDTVLTMKTRWRVSAMAMALR